jgi:hypothetical protein
MKTLYKVTFRGWENATRRTTAGWSSMRMVELFETDDINELNRTYNGEGSSQKLMVDVQILRTESQPMNKQETDQCSFQQAMFWYLKGFEDSETTDRQQVSLEQTMRDAETHFQLVWNNFNTQTN